MDPLVANWFGIRIGGPADDSGSGASGARPAVEDAQVEQGPVWINLAVDDRMEMEHSQVLGGADLDEDDLVAVDDLM